MRKSREETLQELAPIYLEGRSQSFIDDFNAKDFTRRYQCIMQWKRRHGVGHTTPRAVSPAKVVDALGLSKMLKKVIKILDGGIEMTAKENEKIGKQLNEIRVKLSQQGDIIRQREIEQLERQYNEIANRLSELRGE